MADTHSHGSSGYVTEINYSADYQRQLNPLRSRLALLSSGHACPKVKVACELGFGLGLSANIHAAASSTEWYGTDFNASQALFAQKLATASGANIKLFDQAFAEFCNRTDLPDFDFIGLHGIWSWISAENRAVIVDFLRRKLKLGGILYISYNTFPGWADFAPIRELMMQHFNTMSAKGHGIISRVEDSFIFINRLLATEPGFMQAAPNIARRLEHMKKRSAKYLTHEFFNRDWDPMYFAEMAKQLEVAKVEYVCSSDYRNLLDYVRLTEDQRAFLAEIPDPVFRESVQSFITNEQFRQEYWVRGAGRMTAAEQVAALRAERLVLVFDPSDVFPLVIKTKFSEVTVSEEITRPLIDLMADHIPRSLGEIADAMRPRGIALPELVRTLVTLIGSRIIAPAQSAEESAAAAKTCADLNAYLLNRSLGDEEIGYLASPITAGGVHVSNAQQIFLKARQHGLNAPAEWARYSFEFMEGQGKQVFKDGKRLDSPEERLGAAIAEAQKFSDKQLPLLLAQGVVA
jgi:SAM-dependent methyltransferase